VLIFYHDPSGFIYTSAETRTAYRITTGLSDTEFDYKKGRSVNTAGYVQFLNKILTTRKARVIHPTVEYLVRMKKLTMALQLYREEHNCTTREALEAIEALRKKMREGQENV
jgi:hypothetical protein